LASRFIVFVLTASFYGREDPALTGKLLEEAPGIFNWALEGLDWLCARGHFIAPRSGSDAVRQLEDLASPIGAFIRERCVVGADYRVPVSDLWEAWRSWCVEDNRGAGTKDVFGRNLMASIPMIRKARLREGEARVYTYEGIGLARNTLSGPGDHLDHRPPGPTGPGDRAMYSPAEEVA
jgi:putative DNA primase/helicase